MPIRLTYDRTLESLKVLWLVHEKEITDLVELIEGDELEADYNGLTVTTATEINRFFDETFKAKPMYANDLPEKYLQVELLKKLATPKYVKLIASSETRAGNYYFGSEIPNILDVELVCTLLKMGEININKMMPNKAFAKAADLIGLR
ncbi:MAG: hypothetical protein RLZZ469_1655 [Bacteroidota bacterium]|jgi:hypothetical protein